MKKRYKIPGVFVEELSFFPKPIEAVSTDVAAFIGYTEKAIRNNKSLIQIPTRITSLLEFEAYFGKAYSPQFEILPEQANDPFPVLINGQRKTISLHDRQMGFLYPAVLAFFENGGKTCYIISAATYADQASLIIEKSALLKGLTKLEKESEPAIVAVPDAVLLGNQSYEIYQAMLLHCAKFRNRFAILDIPHGFEQNNAGFDRIRDFRSGIGNQHLGFGAAYYPWLIASFLILDELEILKRLSELNLAEILPETHAQSFLNSSPTPTGSYLHQGLLSFSPTYSTLLQTIQKKLRLMPPSGFVAGVYSLVDNTRGVWKAPANVSLNSVNGLTLSISDQDQEILNQDVSGKSINAIREFQGRGFLVWGARTLAGNDHEWKYVSVRRLLIMIEQSIQNGIKSYVFEPNDANTWSSIRSKCQNFLQLLWRRGALAGSKPEHAFFVKVGLGESMSAEDIFEKKLIVEIGLAAMRPAEFIILRIQLNLKG